MATLSFISRSTTHLLTLISVVEHRYQFVAYCVQRQNATESPLLRYCCYYLHYINIIFITLYECNGNGSR